VSLLPQLIDTIGLKDHHIRALQEKLGDLGGGYFPRKGKDALGAFDAAAWRKGQREGVAGEKETWGEVFEWWGGVGEEERRDWEVVVGGLRVGAVAGGGGGGGGGGWGGGPPRGDEGEKKVCLLMRGGG